MKLINVVRLMVSGDLHKKNYFNDIPFLKMA